MPDSNPLVDQLQTQLQLRIPAAKLAISPLPGHPSIRLWLLSADYPQWELNATQAADLMNEPPFWSFCWASGQVLAQFFAEHPHYVEGKHVVDFGGGSGVVAIAAMKAGARKATVCDIDENARLASLCNASLNDVELDCVSSIEQIPPCDLITVADVFYDRDNLPLLADLQGRCTQLLVADSRLNGKGLENMSIIGQSRSHTLPDLDESQEFRHVTLYQTSLSQ